MKLIRNISSFVDNKLFERHIPDISNCISKCANKSVTNGNDFLVELLGTFTNTFIPNYSHHDLIKNYSLLDGLKKFLIPGFDDDDLVLQVIMTVGILASDVKSVAALSNPQVLKTVSDYI
eukprot:UN07857